MVIIKFYKNILLLVIFFLCSCTTTTYSIDKKILKLQNSTFDVVEKELRIQDNTPAPLKKLAESWFNEKIKVDGFDGKLTISLNNYFENISKIDNGKRVDMTLEFNIEVTKSNNSQKKKIKGEVKTFGTITGDFSLNDFDVLVLKSQSDLIEILSNKINS